MKPARALLIVSTLLLLCAPLLAAAPAPRLVFAPSEWNFDSIIQGQAAQADVRVTNRETASLQVTFVPTCSCLTVIPASARIAAGGSAAFHLVYDSSDDTGITTRGYIVRTDLPGAEPLYYLLSGVVRAEHAAPGASAPAAGAPTTAAGAPTTPAGAGTRQAQGAALPIDYYYTPGCRSCEEFLSATLPRLAAARDLDVRVRRVDVLQADGYRELIQLAQSRAEPLRSIPALRIGAVLLQGDAEIRAAMPGLLDAAKALPPAAQAPVSPSSPGETGPESAGVAAIRLAILPVVGAGLLDGINPCAFTTLIFLLASLALAGRGRGEVLLIGSLFSLAVFASYFLIGLGFFTAMRAAAAVPLISVVLRWVLVTVLALFAGLSLYDYTLIRRGRAGQMVLQLPLALKQRIHASIRTRVRAVALAGSSLVLGFLVSVFEFACTAQVYLPTLAWLARTGDRARGIGLLLLYNLAFIVPLLVVFAASYTGVSSARIASSFQRHMGKVKIGLAVVFAGLAVVTLVA